MKLRNVMQSRGQACLSWLSFKDFLKQLLCVTIYLFLMTEILREIAFVWGWSKWCPKNCLAASHFHNCIKLLFSLSDQLAKLAETGGSWQYTQLDLDRFSTVKQANKALTTASEIKRISSLLCKHTVVSEVIPLLPSHTMSWAQWQDTLQPSSY